SLLPATQTLAVMIYSVTVTPTILNCPVTKTLALTINNPPSPALTLPAPVCNTFPATWLTATPGGGTWSANPGVTAAGLLSPNLASIGTNTVVYSVSAGNCIASGTGTFSVSEFHTPALTSSLSLVCEKDPQYNLMNLVQDTVAGRWDGTNIQNDRYFMPQGLLSGTYNFTYFTRSTPIASVCPASTVLAVQVFNPPTPTIVNIAARCDNSGTISLSAQPSGGQWSVSGGIN